MQRKSGAVSVLKVDDILGSRYSSHVIKQYEKCVGPAAAYYEAAHQGGNFREGLYEAEWYFYS